MFFNLYVKTRSRTLRKHNFLPSVCYSSGKIFTVARAWDLLVHHWCDVWVEVRVAVCDF